MSIALSFDTVEAPPLQIRRFTVQEYHQLGEIGLLAAEDRVELLEGWIVQKMNQRPAHGFVVGLLNQWIVNNLPNGWICRCQLPITTDRSELEPDIAVVAGTHKGFRSRHPMGSDCRLVIEVADTSVAKDRAKASIYATAGVDEYWIINLIENQLERYSASDGTIYIEQTIIQAAESIELKIGNTTLVLALGELFAD